MPRCSQNFAKRPAASQINTARKGMQAEVKAKSERIKDLALRLQRFPLRPGAPAHALAAEEIKTLNYSLELRQKRLQKELKKKVEQQTMQILSELRLVIEGYGKRYKYTLILKVDDGGRPAKGALDHSFQEEIFRAQISDVLYRAGALDITKNVLKLLNSPQNLRKMERRAKEAPAEKRSGRF